MAFKILYNFNTYYIQYQCVIACCLLIIFLLLYTSMVLENISFNSNKLLCVTNILCIIKQFQSKWLYLSWNIGNTSQILLFEVNTKFFNVTRNEHRYHKMQGKMYKAFNYLINASCSINMLMLVPPKCIYDSMPLVTYKCLEM